MKQQVKCTAKAQITVIEQTFSTIVKYKPVWTQETLTFLLFKSDLRQVRLLGNTPDMISYILYEVPYNTFMGC